MIPNGKVAEDLRFMCNIHDLNLLENTALGMFGVSWISFFDKTQLVWLLFGKFLYLECWDSMLIGRES